MSGKMLSHTDASSELSANITVDTAQWNSSHQGSQHYAPQFPYAILDEGWVQHLVNASLAKGETMRSMFANNASDLRNHNDQAGNDTLNSDMCSVSHDNESAWFSTEFQATLHFMYITIFLIAVFGNGIVCFIVCTSSRMQTVTNYFIANLALSDMLMAFFCIPFSFISLFVLQ